MKIAHVTPYFHPEFYGSHEAFLSKELVRRGHEVTLFTSNEMPRWGGAKGLSQELPLGEEEWEGVRIIRVPAGPTFSFVPSLPSLPRELRREDFDVFLSHEVFSIVAWHTSRAAKKAGVPFVLVQHGYNGGRRLHFRLLFQLQFALMGRRVLKSADAVISLTAMGRDFLVGLGADPKRIHVHPTGVDCALFRPREADSETVVTSSNASRPLTFGALGRVDRDKGALVLLEAFARASHGREDRLLFAGTGDAEDELRQRSKELGLADRVELLGRLPHAEVTRFLQSLDAIAIPTLHVEPFGIVAVEAAAVGTPAVASRLGGLEETIVDGETGLLIAPGSEDELTAALERFLSEPELLPKLSCAARARATDAYDWPIIAQKFEAHFEYTTNAKLAESAK